MPIALVNLVILNHNMVAAPASAAPAPAPAAAHAPSTNDDDCQWWLRNQ